MLTTHIGDVAITIATAFAITFAVAVCERAPTLMLTVNSTQQWWIQDFSWEGANLVGDANSQCGYIS